MDYRYIIYKNNIELIQTGVAEPMLTSMKIRESICKIALTMLGAKITRMLFPRMIFHLIG